MRFATALYLVVLCLCLTTIVAAQDAVKVDPNHYSVVSENNEVRILKIHYGPHEKSVMHSHPDSVVVFLTDGKVQFTDKDGKKTDADFKPGQSQFTPAQVHLPENTGDQAMEGILVELKGKSTKAKAAAK